MTSERRNAQNPPGLQFFGNAVELDCHVQDLKLLLKKTEEIEFPDHTEVPEGESLIGDIHPDLTRKSFIVLLMIALDEHMKTFCEILKDATGNKLGWNSLKGSSIERFLAYAEKVCGLNLQIDETMRQSVRGLIEVRNCIVHNDSSLDGFGKPKVVESFAEAVPGMSIERSYLVLEKDACIRCANIMHSFMDKAYRAAFEAYPDRGR
ncbi:MAG: hypothetical protein QNJ14_00920 [Woeseiaceae bacterium]|nr:hypothetical protein [Woeseiaceae bacterium]